MTFWSYDAIGTSIIKIRCNMTFWSCEPLVRVFVSSDTNDTINNTTAFVKLRLFQLGAL